MQRRIVREKMIFGVYWSTFVYFINIKEWSADSRTKLLCLGGGGLQVISLNTRRRTRVPKDTQIQEENNTEYLISF
jgi:hypothetical protein